VAKAIEAAVVSRKMPPWFADPKYGHFSTTVLCPERHQHHRRVGDGGAPEGKPRTRRVPSPGQPMAGWSSRITW